MSDETLQEKYIRELLDPRMSKTPRENAAAEEIRALRAKLGIVDEAQPQPQEKKKLFRGDK